MTSDIPCRATPLLSQELLTPAFAWSHQALPCDKPRGFQRHARITHTAACLRLLCALSGMPSFGLMPSLTAKPNPFATTCVRFRARVPHPFEPHEPVLFLSGKNCRAALPCAIPAYLAAHLDLTGKMPLTDLCNQPSPRAPENRSNPGALTPGEAAFDDALQLRTKHTPFPFVAERNKLRS